MIPRKNRARLFPLLALALAAVPSLAAGPAAVDGAAARFGEHVRWLSDDAREGRGLGTQGLVAARDWVAARFREAGVEPAGEEGGWLQPFEVPHAVAEHHQVPLPAGLEKAGSEKGLPAANVLGVIRAGAPDRLPGAVVVGAHYDHIGTGGRSSLDPDSGEVHNGADDNASGTAALVEVARRLTARRGELRRDVYLAAFAAEEVGVIGSTAFTRRPPQGLRMEDLAGMLNMDMVGRLRDDRLTVLGGDSAEEWEALIGPVCERAALRCTAHGDGYGASDQSPFYAAGVPVLHFFTGTHSDYHKPSDDAGKVNAAGGVRIAGVVAETALALANRPERLTYKSAPAPEPAGGARSSSVSLGTVPDYAGDGRPGVLLSGVRTGSPAEKGGLRRGDLLVELAGTPIRDIHDMMSVLRQGKPGETVTAVVQRDGARLALQVTFEASRGMR